MSTFMLHHSRYYRAGFVGVFAAALLLPAQTGGESTRPGVPRRVSSTPVTGVSTLQTADTTNPKSKIQNPKSWVRLAAAPRSTARRAATRVAQAPVNGSGVKAGNGNGTKSNGARPIQLDFREVDIDNVLKFFSMAAGKTLVKDPGLTGPVTILLPQPVTLDEGFRILEAVLNTKGYTLQQEPMLMRVIAQRGTGGRGGGGRGFGGSGEGFGGGERGFGGGGRGGGPQITVFKLEAASAQQVARIINDLFRGGAGGGGGRGRGGGGRFQGVGNQGGEQQGAENALAALLGTQVRASADDYTNSVAVVAPNPMLPQIRTLIEQLDKKVTPNVTTRVFRLEYSSAEEMAPLVSNVLLGAAPTGAAGGALQNVPFEQRVRLSSRVGSLGASAGQVVPDVRTNSLIVSTTDENLVVVERIIKELDTPVRTEPTTFVFRLENARATDLATLMNQAFNTTGRGFGLGGFGGFGGLGQGFGGNVGNQNRFGNQGRGNNRNLGGGNRPGGNRPGGLGGGNRRSAAPEDDGLRLAAFQEEEELLEEEELGQTFESAQLPRARSGVRVQSPYQRGTQRGVGGFGGFGGLGLNQPVTVVPDTNSNSLIINSDPANMEMVRDLIRRLDVVSEQVLIEALIVEASLDRSTKLGIDWTWSHSLGGDTAGQARSQTGLGGVTSGLRYSVTGTNIQAVLQALATDQRFNILATPRIFTSNNQPAEINIGQQVPYIISTRETDEGTQTFNYGYMDVGIILNVVPRIAQSGLVTMDVQQEANELQGFTTFNAPIVAQRTTNTQVSVMDGQTVIIGGIIRDTETKSVNKVPILGDLPLIGGLFRSTDKLKNKTELMVFLTPRIVRNPGQAATLTEQQKSQLRTPIPPSPGPVPDGATTDPKSGTPPPERGAAPVP